MKTFLSFVLVLLFAASVSAADNKSGKNAPATPVTLNVSGTVVDENTGETLVGVVVKLEGTDKQAMTDFDGHFSFDEVVPGEYDLTASFISYEKCELKKQNLDIFSGEMEVKLKPVN